jgi:salicylate hydroxylase
MDSHKYKIVIAGAGFAGGILGRQLQKYTDAEVLMFDKSTNIKDSDTGTGLNLNPNGMSALRSLDPELERDFRSYGLPRSRMKAETMSGKPLYDEAIFDEKGDGLALNTGLRIRWADAYTAVRQGLPIQYSHHVVDYAVDTKKDHGAVSIHVENHLTGEKISVENVDLLVGADGRYSKVREKMSRPETTFIGVTNFRLLVPDTSGDLFEDMELIYNVTSKKSGQPRKLEKEFQYAAQGLPRIGIMKMPETPNRPQMIYIFGNFGIKDAIPDASKTKEGLLALYDSADGTLSAKGKYILDTLDKNVHQLHWARMQHTNPLLGKPLDNVLLLGDAAHAIVPTIEDAAVASDVLIRKIQNGTLGPRALREIETARLSRRIYVSDVSLEASEHLLPQRVSQTEVMRREVKAWQDESAGFRRKLRHVWRGGPVVHQDFDMTPKSSAPKKGLVR